MPGPRPVIGAEPRSEDPPLPTATVVPRGRLQRVWYVLPLLLVVGLFALRAAFHTDPRALLAPSAAEPTDPPGAVVGTGSVAVTRGGPLIIGFQSDGPARLVVAGRTISGQGLKTERIVVPAGPLAIRFAAASDARLVWSPVGRRGDPEYLPESSVSPEPPEAATFSSPGTNLLDGLVALTLLTTLVTSLLYAARERLARVRRATWIGMGAVFGVAMLARLLDLGGAGQTWDEDVNWAAGRNYVTNVLALDFSERAWRWNFEHPPIMKVLAGVGAQFADGFGPARALSALWLSVGCALLVPIGRRLYTHRVGVLAGLIAALLPHLVAHGQIVGHESPTVLWWALGILLSLGVHDALPDGDTGLRILRRRLAAIGVVVGIAVASRFVNGLLGPLCVAIVIITSPAVWRRSTLVWLPLMVLATVLTFYAVWPRLWADPVGALRLSLSKLDSLHAPEPFLGAITAKPSPAYFVVYLVATLPVGVLLASVLGFVRTAIDRDRTSVIMLTWLVIPLAITLSPVRQDGVRYVMPCVLAFTMFAAAGLDFAVRRITVSNAFIGLSAGLVLYLGVTLVRVHPYYLDYYGEQVGGPRGVAERRWFETAWWGEGVDRAVAYVNAHAGPKERVYRDCILPAHLAWFREDLWNSLARPEHADWIVVYVSTTSTCRIPADAHKVFEVDVAGAPLAQVYRRR
ncbi:MAG: glycosyltransferase family 39 protein [Kofleriaceae bacterium]|nr:glycosyltransferase family 39 protein [Kofleriaceae bacterium]